MNAKAPVIRLLVAVTAWFLAITAYAQPFGGMPMHGHMPPPAHGMGFGDDPMPPFLRGVNLTDDQRDKIFSIQHAQMPVLREKHKAVRKAHEELHALVTSNAYDDAKAKALAESSARAMADLALLRASTDHQIYGLLTPEQRAQVEKMHAAIRDRRPGRPSGPLPLR